MAEDFLAKLPRVAKEELSEDKNCTICQQQYGVASDSEPAEEAVRLPCPGGHIVGVNCISRWLLDNMDRNTCPYCRHEFFALITPIPDRFRELLNDQSERGLDRAQRIFNRHQDHFEHWLDVSFMFHTFLEAARASPVLMRRWDFWFADWCLAALNVDDAAINRARTARDDFFERTGLTEMPADTPRIAWSETGSSTEIEPLASAIQTLRFREYNAYILTQRTSILMDGPVWGLNREREGAEYRRLRSMGAFEGVLEEVELRFERWQILRSQGYVFDERRVMWSALPYHAVP